MSTALKRGRSINPAAAAAARGWREKRIRELKKKCSDGTGNLLSLTRKERHELSRLTGSFPGDKILD